MTGRYTPRHGIYTVGSGARGRAEHRVLEPAPNRTELAGEFRTLAEELRARGYRTFHVGKWHLGAPGKGGPEEHGFDVNIAGFQAGHPRSYFSPYSNPALPDGPEGEYLTDRLTDEALALIDDQVTERPDQPFFLHFAHYTVHTPIQTSARDMAPFTDAAPDGGQDDPQYAGMVASLDRSVGRVLDRLAHHGVVEETVVVFTSDNGGLGGYGDLGARSVTDNHPLRGGKGMLYEGGIRVPTIVRWPGITAPGSVSTVPIVTMDLYPTLLAAAGGDPAPESDGVDFRPALSGATLTRDAIHFHFPGYLEADARRGTWRTTPAAAIRVGDLKLIEWFEDGHCELYDVTADPGEQHDLASERPADVARLRERMRAWRAEVAAPLPTRPERR